MHEGAAVLLGGRDGAAAHAVQKQARSQAQPYAILTRQRWALCHMTLMLITGISGLQSRYLCRPLISQATAERLDAQQCP